MTTLQELLIRLGLQQPADEAALQPLRTALTHTSAGLEVNHEELEFLGDTNRRSIRLSYSPINSHYGV